MRRVLIAILAGTLVISLFTPTVIYANSMLELDEIIIQLDSEGYDLEQTESSDTNEASQGARDFLWKIYHVILGREPDKDGFEYWLGEVTNFKVTGYELFVFVTTSEEYNSFEASNEDYLCDLYMTFYSREPDPEGYEFWINVLNDPNCNREAVVRDFANSQEWADTCAVAGIRSGSIYTPSPDKVVITPECEAFVERLYDKCLCRDANDDPEGKSYWCTQLASFQVSGQQAAYSFFFSDEYLFSQLFMEDIEVLENFYRVYFDRDSDDEGREFWLKSMQNGNRLAILFNGFCTSQEFSDICDEYGIYEGDTMRLSEDYESLGFYYFMMCEPDGMEVLEEAEDNLIPKATYTYCDVQGITPIETVKIISQKDMQIIDEFAKTHFGSNWTAAQKVAYTFYWIHENFTYAKKGDRVPSSYAEATFISKIGQCAQYNGAMIEMMAYLGYDVRLLKGWRGKTDEIGGPQHYWGEVIIDGNTYCVEVGEKANGGWHFFMLPYGWDGANKYKICGIVQQ